MSKERPVFTEGTMANVEVIDKSTNKKTTSQIKITKIIDENNFEGTDKNGNTVTFILDDVISANIKGITIDGGDNNNYWMFYNEPFKSPMNIAYWAKFNLDAFYDMDIPEIRNKHIFYGSDSYGYSGMYNGGTYVLFVNVNRLPDGYKEDAQKEIS